MKLALEPGTYIVAVSGGVDSVSLLHALQAQPEVKLVVAHFDHGIRHNSKLDRILVQKLAEQYQLPFVYNEGQLGAQASEAAARQVRYRFLRQTQLAANARAVITAHHQDDMLETAIINLLRGTGRKGLIALRNRHDIHRPLLHLPKNDITAYAQDQGLVWREDPTNQNPAYLRNYVRHRLLTRFSEQDRQRLMQLIVNLQKLDQEIDTLLVNLLHYQSASGALDRLWFDHLPHAVAKEVMAAWLRTHGVRKFDRKGLERLVIAAKTSPADKYLDVLQGVRLQVSKDHLALKALER